MAMSLTDQPCTHSHASKSALAVDRSKYVRPPSLIHDLQPAPPRLEIDSRSHHSFFLADAKSAKALTDADYSSKVGMATGILCPPPGLDSEEAPGAWGVYWDEPATIL
jgi:hypothetical protein